MGIKFSAGKVQFTPFVITIDSTGDLETLSRLMVQGYVSSKDGEIISMAREINQAAIKHANGNGIDTARDGQWEYI